MDLVSSIRKTGSRGGVNFNWEDVTTSAHRENYLGHSLKAPVGRWQKGRDLEWYAKADATGSASNETPEEKAARERKEELKAIKEAEEDALARALGLPVAPRNVTGANAVVVAQPRTAPQAGATSEAEGTGPGGDRPRAPKHHGDRERRHRHRRRSRSRSRSRNPDRRGHGHHYHDDDRGRDRDRDRGRRQDKSLEEVYEARQPRTRDDRDDRRSYHRRRSHSREKDARGPRQSNRRDRDRDRSRSIDGPDQRRAYRDGHRAGHRSTSRDRGRSNSPQRYRRRSRERE